MNRIELVKEKDLALQEKNKLKEIIKKYENDFLIKNGRALQKDDREYYKDDFEKYKVNLLFGKACKMLVKNSI